MGRHAWGSSIWLTRTAYEDLCDQMGLRFQLLPVDPKEACARQAFIWCPARDWGSARADRLLLLLWITSNIQQFGDPCSPA